MQPLEIRHSLADALRMVWIPVAVAVVAVTVSFLQNTLTWLWIVGGTIVLVVAAVSVYRTLSGAAPLTLTTDGIEIGDGGTVAWDNIEEIGEAKQRGVFGPVPAIGVRLKNRKRFEETLNGRPPGLKNRDFSGGWDLVWSGAMLPDKPGTVERVIREYRSRAADFRRRR
ncbi:MAG: hypothetical protein Q4G64_06980 [bacterium]|nr:hypothetical protein [bacterium]